MPLSDSLLEHLSAHLGAHIGSAIKIRREVPVGGGSINDCYRLDTNAGCFFVKVISANRFPSMFDAEADGLKRLGASRAIHVPEVIAIGEDHDESYLLLEHIEDGMKSLTFWAQFGRSLALQHACTSSTHGLQRDNYIGSLVQVNAPCASWPEFLIACRLEPQVRMARDRGRIGAADVLRFERLYAKLPALFPQEAPALLHGDLWNRNFLCDAEGRPVLIDPAVYYGHREMDLAMTRLFGGFADAFYGAYMAERPLERGWEERTDLCNLYPLLVHANLFGGTYAQQVSANLKRFA